MRPTATKPRLQALLDRVARENYGVLWAAILDELGVTRGQIRTYLRRGEWTKAGQGLFLVAAVRPCWEQELMLWCRRAPGRTWVSGRAAARLWGLDGFREAVVEVTTTANLRSSSPSQVIHQVRSLPATDAVVLRRLPVISVHRTLVELGNLAHPDDVELAYECARRRRLTTDRRLLRRIGAMGTNGRAGPSVLRHIIETHSRGAPPTDSALEVRFLQFARRYRLPVPERQRAVRRSDGSIARVDFIYPGTRVVVEVDGRSIHERKRQWESDLRRRNRLTAKGFMVLHVTYERLRTDPGGIAAEISEALGRGFV